MAQKLKALPIMWNRDHCYSNSIVIIHLQKALEMEKEIKLKGDGGKAATISEVLFWATILIPLLKSFFLYIHAFVREK